jgi:2-dehydropantoate 2-reductase
MRILILGAGAIGGYFGARLIQAGADVTFIVRERRQQTLRSRGLRVTSDLGDFHGEVQTLLEAPADSGQDIVLIACKANDLDAALTSIAPGVGRGTVILPLLNGIAHLDVIDAVFPAARVWGGVAHLAVTQTPDGAIQHLNRLNTIQFGPRRGGCDERAAKLAELFASTLVDACACARIEHRLWEKLIFIAALAGITCLMRSSVGVVLNTTTGEEALLGLFAECKAIAAADGLALADTQLEQYKSLLTERSSELTSSMLRDIMRGNATEGNHIFGDLCRRARNHGLATPLLDLASAHLQAYELGRRRFHE